VFFEFLVELHVREGDVLLPIDDDLPPCFLGQLIELAVQVEGVPDVRDVDSIGFEGLGDNGEEITFCLLSPDGDTQQTTFFSHIIEIFHHLDGIFSEHQHQVRNDSVVFVR
jgi:hypothetical protein